LDNHGWQEVGMTEIETRVSIPSDVLFQELDGEAVLLNLHTGKYFGWIHRHAHLALSGRIRLLAWHTKDVDEYDVDPER
jgi:hypothetical protein